MQVAPVASASAADAASVPGGSGQMFASAPVCARTMPAPAPAPMPAKPDATITVPADPRLATPALASKDLTWQVGDERIDYTATAGHIDVRGDTGALIGKMFALSYVAKPWMEDDGRSEHHACAAEEKGSSVADAGRADATDSSAALRPVTFCYNGGPGSSSVPINFGGIGPRRVKTDGTNHLNLPAVVEDNPSTLLRQSDLVFLDALGTGYSALAEGTDPTTVFGVDGDADAFCRAIIGWLDANQRWGSPVYLFGESYGTVRNAVLMRLLGERCVPVRGVVMLSALFDWVQTLPGEDLYFLGMLPTYAATARYFGRAGAKADEETWFDDAMAFTETTYAPALLRGDRLPAREKAQVAKKISRLIGLPADLIERYNLRVDLDTFRRSLLADEGRVIGRLDMRFASAAPLPLQGSTAFFAAEDAADDAVEPVWTAAFRAFLQEIGYAGAPIYLTQNYEVVNEHWKWEHREPGMEESAPAPNVAYDIAVALKRNPTMRIAILGGRYDAATTYWNVVHDISCLFLPPELKERISFHLYSCGHMAYVDEPTLEQMGLDMASFYAAS